MTSFCGLSSEDGSAEATLNWLAPTEPDGADGATWLQTSLWKRFSTGTEATFLTSVRPADAS